MRRGCGDAHALLLLWEIFDLVNSVGQSAPMEVIMLSPFLELVVPSSVIAHELDQLMNRHVTDNAG